MGWNQYTWKALVGKTVWSSRPAASSEGHSRTRSCTQTPRLPRPEKGGWAHSAAGCALSCRRLRGARCPRSSRNPRCRPILGVPRKTRKIISFGIALAGPRVTPVREDQWEDGAGAAPRPPHPVPHPNPAGRGERAPLAPCPDSG
ncbi:uncharacterized protein GJ701_005889 [Geothlypis trichas]